MRVLAVVGTRPEAIKMAPVIARLKRDRRFRLTLCSTGQHRDLVGRALAAFGLRVDLDLGVMRRGQSCEAVLRRVVLAMDVALRRLDPELVLVQGDTTSVLGAALAASRRGIAIGHVEAGLRSFDWARPFPEEGNRLLVDHASALLFAPTAAARRNLLAEGVPPRHIFVTGNTAVDALLWARRLGPKWDHPRLRDLPGARLAAVTLHRRESFGAPLRRLFEGLLQAVERLPDLVWVYPVHPNPQVSRLARRVLRHRRVLLLPPLPYPEFVRLLERCEFVLTDSGGIQEEAPTLGKPVLVAREKTERPELLARGGRLIGVSPRRLVSEVLLLASGRGPKPTAKNPFGDGRAAERIVQAILHWRGLGPAPRSFA